MLNTLSTTPKILGPVKIPFTVRSNDILGKKIALDLPEIKPGYACAIEFGSFEDLKIGRKQILTAAMRIYGSGRAQSASNGNVLYVWIKPQELEISAQVKAHLVGKDGFGPVVSQESTAQGTDKGVSYD